VPAVPTSASTSRPVPTAHPGEPGHVLELFAGVGGFGLALEQQLLGRDLQGSWRWQRPSCPDWKVVFGNQWEPATTRQHAFEVYRARFPQGTHSNLDIRRLLDDAGVPNFDGVSVNDRLALDTHRLPAHIDLLVGGFPCQDYSVAKPLHQARGIEGAKGVLWWQIARILQQWRPRQMLLENVGALLTSPAGRRGQAFAVMLTCLAQLGYSVEWRTITASDYGMPQKRKRVFIYAWQQEDRSPPTSAELQAGIFNAGFPAELVPLAPIDLHHGGSLDPHATSSRWPEKGSARPFGDAGLMRAGSCVVARALPDPAGQLHGVKLGELLIEVDDDSPLWVGEDSLERWRYLKGAKDTGRYQEGAMAFPDPLDRPARTITTSEGGSSPARGRHVVEQHGRLRRLDPVELERANMFPDGWSEPLAAAKRAFTMGNALVLGVVSRLSPLMASHRLELQASDRQAA
jgi:DNA (cytosine-5)-methyltransferase 1